MIPRYSRESLPPYRFVPGESPHPTRSPAGHSYGRELAPIVIDDQSWRSCEPYLFAIDLFNHGYYWEAHEALEAIWRGVGPHTPIGTFAQGVIQAAAALLKHAMDERGSANRLASAAVAKLRAGTAVILGVEAWAFADRLEQYLDGQLAEPPRLELRECGGRSDPNGPPVRGPFT